MLSLLLAVPSCIYSFRHSVIPTSYFIFNDVYIGLHVSAFKGTGLFFIMHSILLVYRKRPGAVYREQKSISERAVEHTEEDPEGGVEEGEAGERSSLLSHGKDRGQYSTADIQ